MAKKIDNNIRIGVLGAGKSTAEVMSINGITNLVCFALYAKTLFSTMSGFCHEGLPTLDTHLYAFCTHVHTA